MAKPPDAVRLLPVVAVRVLLAWKVNKLPDKVELVRLKFPLLASNEMFPAVDPVLLS